MINDAPRCIACGRALRTPDSVLSGYGPTCARKLGRALERADALRGEPGAQLLFPDNDRPLIEQAEQEVTRVAQRKPGR